VRERGVVDQGERIVETISRQGRIRLEGEDIPISDRGGFSRARYRSGEKRRLKS
jgi:hypothetical protein